MFLVLQLKKNIIVPPSELDSLVIRRLEGRLRRAVEGSELAPYGLVMAVVDIVGGNRIDAKVLDDGSVKVVVDYRALVFRLEKDEVVDAVVDRVTQEGLFCDVGPSTVHVPRSQIPATYSFDPTSALVARYVSEDGIKSIAPGNIARIRIIAEYGGDKKEFRAVATMNDRFLGPRA